MKKLSKTAIFLLAVILLFSSCGENPQSEIEEPQNEAEISSNDEEKDEQEHLFDPETENLMELLWTSENPSEEMLNKGYAFYGAEECIGYENLLSFAEEYPQNAEKVFYIAGLGTTWKLYRISYSEDEGSWIYTEYWIDNFDRREHRERISVIYEIKIYDNRVSVYFESGGKNVIYEKGSELGLPSNNCSHNRQAHYIDIEIIRYINSEEFAKKYAESHSEAYLNFDEYTDTLYSEEEECVINIYNYIEYYGLTYDDFIAAYGSEERIAEIWGDADIKGYFKK